MKIIILLTLSLFLLPINLSAQNGLSVNAYIVEHPIIAVKFDLLKFNQDLNRYIRNINKKVVSTALIRNMVFFEPFYAGPVSNHNKIGSLLDYLISYQIGSPDSWLWKKFSTASKKKRLE